MEKRIEIRVCTVTFAQMGENKNLANFSEDCKFSAHLPGNWATFTGCTDIAYTAFCNKEVALMADRATYGRFQDEVDVAEAVKLAERGENVNFYFYIDGKIGLTKIKEMATYIGEGLSL